MLLCPLVVTCVQVQQAAKDDGYGVGKMYNSISNQTRWHLSLETTFPFVYNIDLECVAALPHLFLSLLALIVPSGPRPGLKLRPPTAPPSQVGRP